MKIYTGTGDRGKTSLFSGERVKKNSPRIEAYGCLDELNSVIGAIAAAMDEAPSGLENELQTIQAELLQAGAWLAVAPDSEAIEQLTPFTKDPIERVEKAIDRIHDDLPELRGFILPGGHLSAAMAHMARTICRRAERRVINLAVAEAIEIQTSDAMQNIAVFINRLSDYFFVLARYCNHLQNIEEVPWQP